MKWTDAYASAGLEGLPNTVQSKRYAFAIVCLPGGIASILYAVYYAANDFDANRSIFFTSLLCAPVPALPRLARWGMLLALSVGVMIVLGVFTVLTYHTGTGSGLFVFMFAAMLASILVLGTDHRWFSLAVVVILTLAMLANLILFTEPLGRSACRSLVSENHL